MGEFAVVAFFDDLGQVGGNVFIVAQIARRIEGREVRDLDYLLAHDRFSSSYFRVRANSLARLMSRLCVALLPPPCTTISRSPCSCSAYAQPQSLWCGVLVPYSMYKPQVRPLCLQSSGGRTHDRVVARAVSRLMTMCSSSA